MNYMLALVCMKHFACMTELCNQSIHSAGTWDPEGTNSLYTFPPYPFLLSFLFHASRAVRSYRYHLEVRDPIWGDYWSHSLHQTVSRGSPKFSSNREVNTSRPIYNPGIISLSPLSLSDRRDWRDTLFKWSLARNLSKSLWHHHINFNRFCRSPWLHGQQIKISYVLKYC